MRGSILLSAALLGLSFAKPLSRRYAVKETHAVPREFSRIDDPPEHHPIRLQIGVRQGQFDVLEKHLLEISDPDHARYGQHLSLAEINKLVKPTDETTDLVREWLYEHVRPEQVQSSPAGDFLSFTLPVSKVEEMLQTKYSVYQHEDGSKLVRTHEWSLPLHLHEHITAVQPTTAFIRSVPQAKTYMSVPIEPELLDVQASVNGTPSVDQVCKTGGVTPLCLRTLYGTVNYEVQAPGRNQVGLTNYLGELNNRSDATLYLQRFRPEALAGATDFRQVSIANGSLQQTQDTPQQLAAGVGVEGSLDVETILGVSWPTPVLAYSTGGMAPFIADADFPTVVNEPYLDWVNFVLQQQSVPQVISNSYADNEDTVPEAFAKLVCNQFAQLSARGVSILFGSGDGGVSGVQSNGSCMSINGTRQFMPLFPSSCPYITSVGATVGFNPEVAAFDPSNKFATGGGFSNYFPRPQYQDAAVEGYLNATGSNFTGMFNRLGRAYPDLSAYGVNYTVAWNGTVILVDGTSASTPTVAGVIALLNDALIAKNMSAMGFLNPWLYKKGKDAMFDVTSGSAIGCNTTGFVATEGWDAATGFGTPRFDKLLKAVGL